jgi:hypothetical protein
MGPLLFAHDKSKKLKFSLVKRFFFVAWGEAYMLAERFLRS